MTELEEGSCEVSLFESWTSYSHPVKPIRALSAEQAQQRTHHQRAYRRDGKLLLLETVERGAVVSSFRYRYRADGKLASVTVLNHEGKTTVLES